MLHLVFSGLFYQNNEIMKWYIKANSIRIKAEFPASKCYKYYPTFQQRRHIVQFASLENLPILSGPGVKIIIAYFDKISLLLEEGKMAMDLGAVHILRHHKIAFFGPSPPLNPPPSSFQVTPPLPLPWWHNMWTGKIAKNSKSWILIRDLHGLFSGVNVDINSFPHFNGKCIWQPMNAQFMCMLSRLCVLEPDLACDHENVLD